MDHICVLCAVVLSSVQNRSWTDIIGCFLTTSCACVFYALVGLTV